MPQLLIVKMFSFSIRRSHQPFGKASPIRVECVLLRKAAKASEVKEEMKESCEMENSEVRFYDVRSSKGRLPFLNKVGCCDTCFSYFCISLGLD